MPYYKPITDSKGRKGYAVQVSDGRDRKICRNWWAEPGWSQKTIERKRNKFAYELEDKLKSGEIKTRKEILAEKKKAAEEARKIKTLQQYVDSVYMPAKEITLSENGRSSYRYNLDKHILPVLGDCSIREITPAQITSLLLNMQKTHKSSSCVKIYNILNGIFKMALMDETVEKNPMLKVQRPRPGKNEKIQDDSDKAFTLEEMNYILDCAAKEPLKWQVYIRLLIETGLRRGEACGIHWDDIDFRNGSIHITHNLQYSKEMGVYETTPKSRAGRSVDIGDVTLTLLKQLREQQARTCISPYVFAKDGSPEPMNPDTPTGYFRSFGKRYQIKDFHPHKLRHTMASLSITNGADMASVSERLGHSDVSVTLRMYTHANEDSKRRAGDILRNVLDSNENVS